MTRLEETGADAGIQSSPRVALLEPATGKAKDLRPGRGPRWSASGQKLAVLDPKLDTLVNVVDSATGDLVATVDTTMASVAWQGERLVYLAGSEVRAWSDSGTVTLGSLSADFVPTPREFDAEFSADGDELIAVRFGPDGAAQEARLFVVGGGARTLTPPEKGIAWSSVGHQLLLLYANHVELRGDQGISTLSSDRVTGVFHTWSPDGHAALFGNVSSNGAPVTLDAWDGHELRASVEAPAASRTSGFSPDGSYFAEVVSTSWGRSSELKIYHCSTS